MNNYWYDTFYYRIVDYHQVLTGHGTPLSMHQLFKIVGTERLFDGVEKVPADNYITYVKLSDILGMCVKQKLPDESQCKTYSWEALIKSVAEFGIKIPTILERYFIKGNHCYRAIEGKHRIRALATIEPYDGNRLVPAILVERDTVYTEFMYIKGLSKICL
jgi:hypothetical protein